MNDLFFTSDEHYGHNRIIDFCNRPFASTSVMTQELITRHNSKVTKQDRTYHLGDIFFKMPLYDALKVMDQLNGQHFLVLGNHDELVLSSKELQSKFVQIYDYKHLKFAGQAIELFHYPMRTWRKREYGAWHLFGHVHGRFDEKPEGLSMDVGVDSYNYYPISFDEIQAKMDLVKV